VAVVVNAITGLVVRLLGENRVARDTLSDRLIRGLGWLWRMVVRVAYVVAAAFIIGIIGGLGLLGGDQINVLADKIRPDEATNLWLDLRKIAGDAVGGIGNLLAVLGELVELFTVLVGALLGGFALSGIAADVLASPLRRIPTPVSHVLGGVLGAISGGILLALTGQFGTWAALLGLLSPFVAAILGGQIATGLYKLALQRRTRARYEVDRVDDIIKWFTFVIGAIVTFYVTLTYLDVQRILVLGTLPPARTVEYLGIELSAYVRDNILVGAVLGGVAGMISGTRAPFPVGSILYNVSRAILNTVRSIEPLIMGLVFVIWVGIGPFAGVLALTLHSIAALGKLYSEQVENIDEGPVEALESTGANRLQTIIYAVVPQIIPPYIAFTMYRWDINVRMSTIIGFVGGGGIGLLLQQQINLLQYREAGVAVLAIAVVVSILDYASASIRARLT
jgi:phosphonate ABC transporter permease subunit PhnE